MKLISTLLFTLLASTAFASFNEVECVSPLSSVRITLEIEQPYSRLSTFRWSQVTMDEETFHYSVSPRSTNGFNHLKYWGSGLSVDIDLWPDSSPSWGRTYQGTLSSHDVLEGRKVPLSCRFPNAF